jgi:hypothetical protein
MAIGHYRASEEDLQKWSTYEKDGIYVSSETILLRFREKCGNLLNYRRTS